MHNSCKGHVACLPSFLQQRALKLSAVISGCVPYSEVTSEKCVGMVYCAAVAPSPPNNLEGPPSSDTGQGSPWESREHDRGHQEGLKHSMDAGFSSSPSPAGASGDSMQEHRGTVRASLVNTIASTCVDIGRSSLCQPSSADVTWTVPGVDRWKASTPHLS